MGYFYEKYLNYLEIINKVKLVKIFCWNKCKWYNYKKLGKELNMVLYSGWWRVFLNFWFIVESLKLDGIDISSDGFILLWFCIKISVN